MRVLIVDDNRDMVVTTMALLRTEAHDTKGLYSAVNIVKEIREYDPDVVILDIAMPGKSGWEAAREIRTAFPGKRPVLIALTGEYTKAPDKLLSEMIGFNYYLMKPCDPNVVLALLKTVRSTALHPAS
jgi:DNA-binding response OmpR family regulator